MENNISTFSDYRKKRIIRKIKYLQENLVTLAKYLVGEKNGRKTKTIR